MAAGNSYCLGIKSNDFFLKDNKKAFILWLNVPKVTAYIHIIFLCITLIGKMCLAYVIYWTVYKSRFIYFVVTKSMALTETPEKLMVFWKYIGKSED